MSGARLWLLLLLMFLPPAWADDAETRLKAIYLGRFAEYVQFATEMEPRAEFVITVLGDNPFGGQLQALYADRRIHGKPVRIEMLRDVQDLVVTDLLFINLPTAHAREAAIDFAWKNLVLTISDARGFAAQGGIIQINFVEQKARITINHAAALGSGLQIGAPLLSIATVLRGELP